MEINIRLYHTLGCSVVANSMLIAIARSFAGAHLRVFSPSPEIQSGLSGVSEIYPLQDADGSRLDVDLAGYLDEYRPLVTKPSRHLKEYIFDIADNSLGVKLDRSFDPVINLTPEEEVWAKAEVSRLSPGKPLVWLQKKTSKSAKDWPGEDWSTLTRELEGDCNFLNLTDKNYSPRAACILTKFCDAGVVLDTFLLHGSHAVGAKNTIAILVVSPQEVVCYNDQIALDGTRDRAQISPENVIGILSHILTTR
jgi:hypothetical protein